jgi:hypothetical protein
MKENEMKMRFHMVASWMLAMCACIANLARADVLHDNGDTDGGVPLSWGQNSSTLDDFYVANAGAWIDGASTLGLWLGSNDEVQDVQVFIWRHDAVANGPDGDSVITMTGEMFTASPTGRQYFGYDEIRVDVEFDPKFLDGQEYYWIEFVVSNQFGHTDFHFLSRQAVTYEPAWIRIGNSVEPSVDVVGSELDLAFQVYGQGISVSELIPTFKPKYTTGIDNGWQEGVLELADDWTLGIPSQPGMKRIEIIVSGRSSVAKSRVVKLMLVIEASAVGGGVALQTASLYDHNGRRYTSETRTTLEGRPTRTNILIDDPTAFMRDRDGQVQAKLAWDLVRPGSSQSWGVSVDQVKWIPYVTNAR